jgi:hypothetical protein
MRLICSWCTTVLREGDPTMPASFALCAGCAERFVQERPGTITRRDVTSAVVYVPHPEIGLWPRS